MPDIAALLENAGIPVRRGGEHHHVTSQYVGVDCPWCGFEGGYHLGIHVSGRFASCWKCGPHSASSALAALLRVPESEARRLLGGAARRDAPERPQGRLRLPPGAGPMLPPHRRYLRSRGLDDVLVESLWGVGGIGAAGRMAWRLVIPVVHQGRVVSWITRTIGKGGRRYVSASAAEESLPHRELLYGGDYVRGAAVAVEGPVDAWAIGPGAVATMGAGFTRAQVVRLAQIPRRAVCFDAEPEAQARQRRLVAELRAFPGETFSVRLESGKDAAEADPAEIAEIRVAVLGAD